MTLTVSTLLNLLLYQLNDTPRADDGYLYVFFGYLIYSDSRNPSWELAVLSFSVRGPYPYII